MSSPLKVEKPKDLQGTFETIKNEVEKNNGTFEGNLENGCISCDGVSGTYKVTGDAIEITITNKPRLWPEFAVKNEIAKIFKNCTC